MINTTTLFIETYFYAINLAILFAFLTVASIKDIKSRRIPNKVVATGILTSLIVKTAFATNPFFPWAAGAPLGFAIFFPLYLMRTMGAGDVKLVAMVGAFLGPAPVLNVVLATLVAGGILGLIFSFHNGTFRLAIKNIQFVFIHTMVKSMTGGNLKVEALPTSAGNLPYAVAITIGTIVYLALSSVGYELAW